MLKARRFSLAFGFFFFFVFLWMWVGVVEAFRFYVKYKSLLKNMFTLTRDDILLGANIIHTCCSQESL